MTVITSDTMADTTGVLLTAHTVTTIGGPWLKHPTAHVNATWRCTSNRFYPNALGTGLTPSIIYPDDAPATAEYDVACDYRYIDDFGNAGLVGRLNATAKTFYHVYHGTGQWVLVKSVAGLLTTLDAVTASLTPATTYAIKLEIRNATKRLFVGGVQTLSSTDNQLTPAGYGGLRSAFQYGDAEGKQFANFVVTDLSVAEEARLGAIIIGD